MSTFMNMIVEEGGATIKQHSASETVNQIQKRLCYVFSMFLYMLDD